MRCYFGYLLLFMSGICTAAPILMYSTMVSDSTWYDVHFRESTNADYADDVSPDGDLYIAAPASLRRHQVYHISPDGSQMDVLFAMEGYEKWKELIWNQSGIYVLADSLYSNTIFKLTHTGELVFSISIGGISYLYSYINEDGSFVITGYIEQEFADQIQTTEDALSSQHNGDYDIFIQKYDLYGNLLYGSFLGGTGGDAVFNITADENGTMYLGAIVSSDFPYPLEGEWHGSSTNWSLIVISPEFDEVHAYYSIIGQGRTMIHDNCIYHDRHLALQRFSLTGEERGVVSFAHELPSLWPPVLEKPSESINEGVSAIIDRKGNIFSVQYKSAYAPFTSTEDALFPEPHPMDTELAIWQVTEDAELLYGTYFGGKYEEESTTNAVVLRDGKLYVVGYSNSPDLPLTQGSYIDSRIPQIYGQDYPWGLFAFCLDFNEPTNVADESLTIPNALILGPPHPNPFNPATSISFTLPEAGFARLAIYNISGQLVRELAAEALPAGQYELVWDGRDTDGALAGSGVYIARLAAGGRTAVQKVTLVR